MAINLGDINFGLGPDTSRLEQARRQVVQFGQAVNQSARAQGDGARAAEAAMRRQEKAILSTLQQVTRLNDAIRKTGDNPAQINRTTQTFNRLVAELGQGRVSALQFQRSMEDVQASLGRVSRAHGQHNAALAATVRQEREASRAAAMQTQEVVKQERVYFSAQQAVERFNASLSRTKNAPSGLATNSTSLLSNLKGSLTPGMDPVAMQRANQAFQAGMLKNTTALKTFQMAQKGASDSGNAMVSSLDRLANVSVLLNGPLGGIAARLNVISSVAEKVSLSTAAMVVGIAGAAYAFVNLGKGAVDAAKQFQRVEASLDALSELSSYTGVQMDYLKGVADRTGASFSEMAPQFARLTASAAGTNLEGERMRRIFEVLTYAGAKLGASADETGGVLKALDQIMSKGSVQAEELRGQLGDRMSGAFRLMADGLGITTQKLGELMKKGQITADALVPFAERIAKKYGIDVTKAIDTVIAAEGRLNNQLLYFNKAADDAIGFSEAYKNSLNIMANTLKFLAENMNTVVNLTVAIGAGFLVMFAPQILAGLWAVAAAVKGITIAMLGLNVATLSNPLGAIAVALVKVVAVVGVATGAFALMENVLNKAADPANTMADALMSNEASLKAASGASTQFRSELLSQIQIQRVAAQAAWDESLAQYSAAKAKLASQQADVNANKYNPAAGFALGSAWGLGDTKRQLADMDSTLTTQSDYLTSLDKQLAEIEAIRKRMGEQNGALDPLGGAGDGSGGKSAAKNIRDAQQAIADLDAQWANAQLPEGMREFANIQTEVTKKVQDFRDKLVDSKVPAQQVVTLTQQYAESLRTLEEGSYALAHTTDAWKQFGDVVGGGLDDAFGQFIDNIVEGKDALLDLRDIGKQVAVDLLKSFVQLAAINPLKNALFGQNNNTLGGGSSGGGGIGGFLSSILGGLFGGGSKLGGGASLGNNIGSGAGSFANFGTAFAAKGMAVTSGGNRFGKGGVFGSPTTFQSPTGPIIGGEAGNEALLPLGRTAKGDLGVKISNDNQTSSAKNEGGDTVFNFYLSANGDEAVMTVVKDAVDSALKIYSKGSLARQQANSMKGKTRRITGLQ